MRSLRYQDTRSVWVHVLIPISFQQGIESFFLERKKVHILLIENTFIETYKGAGFSRILRKTKKTTLRKRELERGLECVRDRGRGTDSFFRNFVEKDIELLFGKQSSCM